MKKEDIEMGVRYRVTYAGGHTVTISTIRWEGDDLIAYITGYVGEQCFFDLSHFVEWERVA